MSFGPRHLGHVVQACVHVKTTPSHAEGWSTARRGAHPILPLTPGGEAAACDPPLPARKQVPPEPDGQMEVRNTAALAFACRETAP